MIKLFWAPQTLIIILKCSLGLPVLLFLFSKSEVMARVLNLRLVNGDTLWSSWGCREPLRPPARKSTSAEGSCLAVPHLSSTPSPDTHTSHHHTPADRDGTYLARAPHCFFILSLTKVNLLLQSCPQFLNANIPVTWALNPLQLRFLWLSPLDEHRDVFHIITLG